MVDFTKEQIAAIDEVERRFNAGQIESENMARAEDILIKAGRIGREALPQLGITARVSPGFEETAGQAITGANLGVLSQTLGAPVDLVAAGLRAIGVDVGEEPLGGSASLRGGLEALGAIGPDPRTETGQAFRTGGEIFGQSVLPAGAGLAAGLGKTGAAALRGALPQASQVGLAKGIGQQIAGGVAQAPGRTALAEAGLATTAGTAGAIGEQVGGPAGEFIGTLAGAFAPIGVAGSLRSVLRGTGKSRVRFADNIETFEQAGTTPSIGEAAQVERVKIFQSLTGRLPGGGRIAREAKRVQNDIGKRLEARTEFGANGPELAGRALQTGLRGFVGRFKESAEGLFNKLDEFVTPETQVEITNTKQTLNRLSAPVEGSENLSGILANPKINQINSAIEADSIIGLSSAERQVLDDPQLRNFFDEDRIGDFTGIDTLPYQSMKDLRSNIGRQIASPELVSDIPKGQLKQLYAALTADMRTAFATQGDDAIRAFDRANKFYAAGIKRIDTRVERLVKNADPEKIFLAVERGGKQGASQIRALRRSVAPDEWEIISQTVGRRLGRARSGTQDEFGEAFSTETFLTNWNNLAPEAKAALFDGVGTVRADLDTIAAASARIREQGQVIPNPSGTAASNANLIALGAGGGAFLAGELGTAGLILASVGVNNSASRLMTNPRFVKWLAQATRIKPERMPAHIARLAKIPSEGDEEFELAVEAFLDNLVGTGAALAEDGQ